MAKEINLSLIVKHLDHTYVYLHDTSINVMNKVIQADPMILASQELLAFQWRMQITFL